MFKSVSIEQNILENKGLGSYFLEVIFMIDDDNRIDRIHDFIEASLSEEISRVMNVAQPAPIMRTGGFVGPASISIARSADEMPPQNLPNDTIEVQAQDYESVTLSGISAIPDYFISDGINNRLSVSNHATTIAPSTRLPFAHIKLNFVNVNKDYVEEKGLCDKTISFMNIVFGNFLKSVTDMDRTLTIGKGKHLGNQHFIDMYTEAVKSIITGTYFGFGDEGKIITCKDMEAGQVPKDTIEATPEPSSLISIVGSEYEDF